MWLPKEDEIPKSFATSLPSRCYNHPVVVLSEMQDAKGEVAVFMITSFGNTSLIVARSESSKARAPYLPIYPSAPHPENRKLLRLAKNRKLVKNSYVNTKTRRAVPLGALRNYEKGREPIRSRYVLGHESFEVLIQHCEASTPLVHMGDLAVQPLATSSDLEEPGHHDNQSPSPLDNLNLPDTPDTRDGLESLNNLDNPDTPDTLDDLENLNNLNNPETPDTLDAFDVPGSFPQVLTTATAIIRSGPRVKTDSPVITRDSLGGALPEADHHARCWPDVLPQLCYTR
ncbi:uncharacterized protein DNG_07807 [Cephalotrichum gorgonifer]|uniref:Uncharacterized protein n=1 Tax=Cephalotrichum gorgonifer TaxID=2041049 RepID=A0AAE8N343_9PEZI|nr:uncharacterized protein DNG_07807 [Cephalotrichum gorgonifer]